MFQMRAVFDKFERAMIRERVQAGLSRTSQQGTEAEIAEVWQAFEAKGE